MPRATSLIVCMLAGPALAQCASWLPGGGVAGVDSYVQTMTTWDPDGTGPATEQYVFGGLFTVAATVNVGYVAAYDPATGTWSDLGGGFDASPRALLAMPNGDLVAAGSFTSAGGAPAGYIARWDGSTWSPLGSGLDSHAGALALLPNGDVVAGGWFTTAGGTATGTVARWDGASWSAIGAPFTEPTTALAALPNGDLVAGHSNSSNGSMLVRRWNGAAWTFLGPAMAGIASSLAVLPSGDIALCNAVGSPPLQRWNGATWSPFGNLQFATDVHVTPGGAVLAVGGPLPVPLVTAHVWNGTSFVPLGAPTIAILDEVMAAANGDVLIAGSFTLGGASNIARWNGTSWAPLVSGWNGSVRALARLPNGHVVAAGEFTAAAGVGASRIAEWDGQTWTPLAGGLDGSVTAILPSPNNELIAGGAFFTAGGASVNGIAHWDGASWSALGSSPVGGAFALLRHSSGDVIAAGYMPNHASRHVARWNGASWSPMGAGLPNTAWALAELPNGDILAGTDGGGVHRWDGSGWTFTGLPGRIWDLLVTPGGVLAASHQVSLWNGSSWTSLGATASASGFGAVRSLVELPNGDLLAGGWFTGIGGTPADNLARWDGTGWSPFDRTDDQVSALLQLPGGDVLAGGDFAFVNGGISSAYFARLDATCPATTAAYGTACAGAAGPMLLEVVRQPWAGSSFEAACTGFGPASLALVVTGFAQVATPLSSLTPAGLPGCDLLANDDAVEMSMPLNGLASKSLPIPFDPALVGVAMHHQFLQLQMAPISAVLGSNGLTMTVGYF